MFVGVSYMAVLCRCAEGNSLVDVSAQETVNKRKDIHGISDGATLEGMQV